MSLDQYNFTLEEEAAVVRKQFEECYKIFRQEAFDGDEAVPCRIHDAFELEPDHHNCLGCNFADIIELIDGFLATHKLFKRLHHVYIQYILLNYLLVERIDTLFNLIELNEAYRQENFKILMAVRRWANFIKHPKAFILTHHAEYTFVGSEKNGDLKGHAGVTIDRTFIDKYFSNDDRNSELYKELENKENVLVEFPDAKYITQEMCRALKLCVGVVSENQVYRSVLKDRTTFLDYFISTETTGASDSTSPPTPTTPS